MQKALRSSMKAMVLGAGMAAMAAWPAASQEMPSDAPAPGTAIVALAVGEACNSIDAEGRKSLQAFLDRSIIEDEAITSRSYKSPMREFVKLFSLSMRRKYGAPGECNPEVQQRAAGTLASVQKYAGDETYWSIVRNPPPTAGQAIELKAYGRHCSGFFTSEQRAAIDMFLATDILKMTRHAERADAAAHLDVVRVFDDESARGWWFPWHCTAAARAKAHDTLRRIEALLPGRLK